MWPLAVSDFLTKRWWIQLELSPVAPAVTLHEIRRLWLNLAKVSKVSHARDCGIVVSPLDADPLDSLLIRLFNRAQ
jgi:hypothetical protein